MANKPEFDSTEGAAEQDAALAADAGVDRPDADVQDADVSDADLVSLDETYSRDTDGVGALHDVEAEAGDETEVDDLFDLDEAEARELGADFTGDQRDEPPLW